MTQNLNWKIKGWGWESSDPHCITLYKNPRHQQKTHIKTTCLKLNSFFKYRRRHIRLYPLVSVIAPSTNAHSLMRHPIHIFIFYHFIFYVSSSENSSIIEWSGEFSDSHSVWDSDGELGIFVTRGSNVSLFDALFKLDFFAFFFALFCNFWSCRAV